MVDTHATQSGEGYILAISEIQLSADFLPQCAVSTLLQCGSMSGKLMYSQETREEDGETW